MLILYLFVGILYPFVLLGLYYFNSIPNSSTKKIDWRPVITVLVPFRNEEDNLTDIFHTLVSQSYLTYEVIWIDDHSKDGSVDLLLCLIDKTKSSNMRVIKNIGEGKKQALTTGVSNSTGEIICTTDADCEVPCRWLESIVEGYHCEEIKMVAGPVIAKEGSTFFYVFQIVEWSSVIFMTSVFYKLKNPLMCSGANLSYRKEIFIEIEGYAGNENILSGDDEFLLKKIVKRFGPHAFNYLLDQNTTVVTHLHNSILSLFSQRIRWASKWNKHQSFSHSMTALIPFILQIFYLSTLSLWANGFKGIFIFLIIWLMKITAESFVLGRVLGFFKKSIAFPHWFWVSFMHPLYVLLVGLGALRGKYSWKDRNQI